MINYKLKYSKKAKYMRLQISRGQELEVVLPRGYQLKDAEKFISSKADWIKKHISAKKDEPVYMFMGQQIQVKEYFQLFITRYKIIFKNGVLEVRSPEDSTVELNVLYEAWLRNAAKKYLNIRVFELADQMGYKVNRLTVRGQRTRWGSCSSGGNLSFNFKLLRYRQEVIDYVIIHELCHLQQMNHSKQFWALVRKHCPDYLRLRKELKGRP